HGFVKADGLGGDDVNQRPTLHSGKNYLVDGGGVFLFAENHSGTGSAQRLVGRRSHDLSMRHGRWMHAACNQSSEVRHVHQVKCADFVSNLTHASEVNDSRIGATTADDQLGTLALGKFFQIVVINRFRFFGHPVGNDVIRFP